MNASIAALFLFGLNFIEQDVPGLEIGETDALSGSVSVNFITSDVDGDAKNDLLLPGVVYFMRDDAFDVSHASRLPARFGPSLCDAWNGEIYVRFEDGLEVLAWKDGNWTQSLSQQIGWPEEISGEAGYRNERFLHDLDNDDKPEIFVAARDGLHVYARDAGKFSESNILDIFPGLQLAVARVSGAGETANGKLWPADKREILMPLRQSLCTVGFEGNTLSVISAQSAGTPGSRVVYKTAKFFIDPNESFGLIAGKTQVSTSPVLDDYLKPCDINGDGQIDFAGARWHVSTSSPLAEPICETSVSIDGGKTIQSFRSHLFSVPKCSFVDFDGDGDRDMIVESTKIFDSGTRELISRFMTSRTLKHSISVHRQDSTGVFSRVADIKGIFSISLESVPYAYGRMFRRYMASQLIDVTGDFNADGFRDIAIRDRSDRVAIYLGSDDGFSRRPVAHLDMKKDWDFKIVDVDGDGRSDLAVRWLESDGGDTESGPVEKLRVFFVRGGGQ